MKSGLMFLLSVIRGHVHKEEDCDQLEMQDISGNRGYTYEETELDNSSNQEALSEKVRMEAGGETGIQPEEAQSEAEVQSKEEELETIQSEEIELEDVQLKDKQPEEVQSEEIALEELQLSEAGLEKETEDETDTAYLSTSEEITEHNEIYNGEYMETEAFFSDDSAEETVCLDTYMEECEAELAEEIIYMLPSTGGAGALVCWIAGAFCIGAAALLWGIGYICRRYIGSC